MRQSYDYNPYGWTPPVGTQRSGEFSHQAYARQAEDEERARLVEQEGIWIPEGSFKQEPVDIAVSSSKQTREQALADPYSHLYKWENIPEGEAELVVEVGTAEGIPAGPQKPLGFPLRRRVLDQDAVEASGVGGRPNYKPLSQFEEEERIKNEHRMALEEKRAQERIGLARETSGIRQGQYDRNMNNQIDRTILQERLRSARPSEQQAIIDEFYSNRKAQIGQPQESTAQQNLQRATPQQTPTPMYPPAQASELQVEVGKTGKKTASGLDIFQDNSGEYVVINGKKTYRKKQQ